MKKPAEEPLKISEVSLINTTSVKSTIEGIPNTWTGPEELTQLFKIINEEPESLRDYVPRESWVQDVEQSRYLWRKSPFYGNYPDFQSRLKS